VKRLAVTLLLLASVWAPSVEGAADGARTASRAICSTFGRYCGQALRVAWCESRLDVWARNGQYRGLFQMGARERATYGDGIGAWAQSRAALRYFRATGYTWRPWSCKP
jgi:hypothetical protein